MNTTDIIKHSLIKVFTTDIMKYILSSEWVQTTKPTTYPGRYEYIIALRQQQHCTYMCITCAHHRLIDFYIQELAENNKIGKSEDRRSLCSSMES